MANLNSSKVHLVIQSSAIHPPANYHPGYSSPIVDATGSSQESACSTTPLRPVYFISAVHPFPGESHLPVNPKFAHLRHQFVYFTETAPSQSLPGPQTPPQPQNQHQVQPPVTRIHSQQPSTPTPHLQSQPQNPGAFLTQQRQQLLTLRQQGQQQGQSQQHLFLLQQHRRDQRQVHRTQQPPNQLHALQRLLTSQQQGLQHLQQLGKHQQHVHFLQQHRLTQRKYTHHHRQFLQQQYRRYLLHHRQIVAQQPKRWILHVLDLPNPFEKVRPVFPIVDPPSRVFYSLSYAVESVEKAIRQVTEKCERLYGEKIAVGSLLPAGGKEVLTNRVRSWDYRVVEDWSYLGTGIGMCEVWYWWDIVEIQVVEKKTA